MGRRGSHRLARYREVDQSEHRRCFDVRARPGRPAKRRRRSTTRPGRAGPGQAGLPRSPSSTVSGTATGPRPHRWGQALLRFDVGHSLATGVLGFAPRWAPRHCAGLRRVGYYGSSGARRPGAWRRPAHGQGSKYTAFQAACVRLSVTQSKGGPASRPRGHRILALHLGVRAAPGRIRMV